ncbi:MAG TPA: divalent metal cation transporter [Wenzhouxiangella sp.]
MVSSLSKAIGPGLIMAGAAIGVSHLVQSTRAGAEYGTTLIPLILLACLFKYPFLEFGPRYAAATGESMLVGFKRLGNWALVLFALVTLSTMFVILASVTLVTAGLAGVVFGLEVSPTWLSLGVLLVCMTLLVLGQYRGLDTGMKWVMGALLVSTLAATSLAMFGQDDWSPLNPMAHWDAVWTAAGIAFVLALLGWMPIPLDVAAWHSLWTLERARQTGHTPSVQESVFDFRLGYLAATVSAIIFVVLGAVVLAGSDTALPTGAVAFSDQLIRLYTASLGEWSHVLIAVGALSAMFSTTLAVIDAYPRVLQGLMDLKATPTPHQSVDGDGHVPMRRYVILLTLMAAGALLIIATVGQQFTRLIDFATTVSFLSAPILAWLSLRLITSPWVAPQHQPSKPLRYLAGAGLVFLIGFCVAWAFWRFN